VTHYDLLDVAPDAEPAEIRRAYLRLARAHHPDLQGSEGRMREINAAWSVLGDPERRRDYDRSIGREVGPAGPGEPTGPRLHQPSTEFHPIHDADEDDDDSWRYEPDEYDPRTAIGRFLGAGPPILLLVGVVVFAVSLVVGLRELMALAVALLLLAGALFIGAPLVAVTRSQAAEDRSRSRRDTGGR
jgi:hypothetical protein